MRGRERRLNRKLKNCAILKYRDNKERNCGAGEGEGSLNKKNVEWKIKIIKNE